MIENITALQAWELLKTKANACLVDVRTAAEWTFVGVPDLKSINKTPIFISLYKYQDRQLNMHFAEDLKKQVPEKDTTILFTCRSGGRSLEASKVAFSLGYKKIYNIVDGFEGHLDKNSHRNSYEGWKFSKLPWKQD
jgi:rhodanese-related sulfurtransferase